MKKYPVVIVAWVNPISTLQTGKEICEVIEYLIKHALDSLITVMEEQVHCVNENQPVSFSIEGKSAQTQGLKPVQPFVYLIMMWKTSLYVQVMEQRVTCYC